MPQGTSTFHPGAQALVSRLEYVRETGANRWVARCPAHDDRDPSLSISELNDGRVLIHCHAGCGALAVLDAVGLSWDALFPPNSERYRPIRARDKSLEHERMVLAICAADRAAGKRLTPEDRAREEAAWLRVHGGATA